MAVYDFFSIHFYDIHPGDRMPTNKRSSVLTYLVRLLYDIMRMLICKAVNLPPTYIVTETQLRLYLKYFASLFSFRCNSACDANAFLQTLHSYSLSSECEAI